MKKTITQKTNLAVAILALFMVTACLEREDGDLVPAKFPDSPVVYADGFSSGMEYYPYADSKVDAFDVDTDTKYQGTSSMRFDVPPSSEAYAGAIFRDDNGGRDLTAYNVLTFWAKATRTATIDNIGFGQDFFGNPWEVSAANITFSTKWEKYYIPIPDASKLTQSQGLLWYSTAAAEGYTFWLDEVQYENLGTVAHIEGLFNGNGSH